MVQRTTAAASAAAAAAARSRRRLRENGVAPHPLEAMRQEFVGSDGQVRTAAAGGGQRLVFGMGLPGNAIDTAFTGGAIAKLLVVVWLSKLPAGERPYYNLKKPVLLWHRPPLAHANGHRLSFLCPSPCPSLPTQLAILYDTTMRGLVQRKIGGELYIRALSASTQGTHARRAAHRAARRLGGETDS